MRFLKRAKMKTIRDASGAAKPVPAAAQGGELPPAPSADQPFYDESLRASMRSLGRLIQGRRKAGA
jgi:hypothetical protein